MTEQSGFEPKRAYDPVGMRGRLLDAAAAAFQSRGYHSTSMHDIVRAADSTGGALYHHFPTKKALGLAVLRERVAKEVEETWIEPVRRARSAADGILAAFDNVIADLDGRGTVLGCPLNNLALELSLADPEFQLAVQRVFEDWRIAIAKRLRADRAAEAAKDLDPELFATLVVASFSGAMGLAKAEQNADALRACARQLARIMRPLQRAKRRTG
jgi:AcrR family transcriptional regulator